MSQTRSQLEEPLCRKLISLDQDIERHEILLLISKYNIGRLPVDHIALQNMTGEDCEMMNIFNYRERDFAMLPIEERKEADINRQPIYPDGAIEYAYPGAFPDELDDLETEMGCLSLASSRTAYSSPDSVEESNSDVPSPSLLCEDSCEKYGDIWWSRHGHGSGGGEEREEGEELRFDEDNFRKNCPDPPSYISATLEFSKKELLSVLENDRYWGSDINAVSPTVSNPMAFKKIENFVQLANGKEYIETKNDLGASFEIKDVEKLVRRWRAEEQIPDSNWFVWRLERYCEFCRAVGEEIDPEIVERARLLVEHAREQGWLEG